MAQVAILAVMALSALNDGAQKRKMKRHEGDAIGDAANRKMASTTAKMEEGKRRKEHMESRLLAVAAASGGGIDDPTIVNVLGDLNAEGEYRILADLYVGQSEAEGLRFQQDQAYREGDAALQAGYVNAVKTVMSAYGGAKAPTTGATGMSSSGLQQSPSANPPRTTLWSA